MEIIITIVAVLFAYVGLIGVTMALAYLNAIATTASRK